MKAMARQRSHSIAFKRQVAQEFIAGERRTPEKGQNPNASRMLACQLWPAADKPPHALYSAMCRLTSARWTFRKVSGITIRPPLGSRGCAANDGFTTQISFCLDASSPDDWPPFLDIGLLQCSERFGRLLIGRKNLLPEID